MFHLSCGGGNCYTYTVTFHVYTTGGASDSLILVTGIGDFGDGGSYQFNSCLVYDIAPANTASGYAFWYWYGSSANIGNSLASSTWFSPTGNGVLMLVLKIPASAASSIWGGYVEGSGSGSLTTATGYFTIPGSFTYVSTQQSDNPSTTGCFPGASSDLYDEVSYWVGIGGVNGNAYLWQAGVYVWVEQNGKVYIAEWYEEASPTTNTPPTFNCPTTSNPNPGDRMKVYVFFNTGGVVGGSVEDITQSTNWPLPQPRFTPDSSTVEWVVEDPSYKRWTVPKVSGVLFTDCFSSGYANFLSPTMGFFTTDNQGNLISPQTFVTVNSFGVSEA